MLGLRTGVRFVLFVGYFTRWLLFMRTGVRVCEFRHIGKKCALGACNRCTFPVRCFHEVIASLTTGDNMTKKDYELIAEAIHAELTAGNLDLGTYADITTAIAHALKKDNPAFLRGTFLNACGWLEAYGYEWDKKGEVEGGR